MATGNQSRFNKELRDNESLTQLIKILDEEQPYNKFSSFSDPKLGTENNEIIKKVQGSLIGLAVGDALGASVEFRPNAYLKQYPVSDMQRGGTWGLESGQWTDDTSMTLCLAASLIVKGEFDTYDINDGIDLGICLLLANVLTLERLHVKRLLLSKIVNVKLFKN
jgi:hypothetical protein